MSSFARLLAEPLESEIQAGMRNALHQLGFWTWNLSQNRPTRQSRGLPDFLAVGRGVLALVEVKRKKTKQSEAQKQLQAHVDALRNPAVVYVVLRSAVEAVKWAEKLPRKGGA